MQPAVSFPLERKHTHHPRHAGPLVSASTAANRGVSNSKKRKSDELKETTQLNVFSATFLSYGTQSAVQSATFSPVTCLERARLPLFWLATHASPTIRDPLPSGVFEADIPSVKDWECRVLVVRHLPNGRLFAVEKVGISHFIACALQPWVSEEWCQAATVGQTPKFAMADILKYQGERPDSNVRAPARRPSQVRSAIQSTTPQLPKHPTNKRGSLARLSILTPRNDVVDHDHEQERTAAREDSAGAVDAQHTSVPANSKHTLPSTAAVPLARELSATPATPFDDHGHLDQPLELHDPDPAIRPTTESDKPGTPENLCTPVRLRAQYSEHLYLSKTSLAFYVKGPLSRARAHVRSSELPMPAILDLADFYDRSILSTKKIDLKYKTTLPSIIEALGVENQRADSKVAVHQKKPRKKQSGPGKDALWPEEEELVARWWPSRQLKPTTTTAPVTLTDEIHSELTDLRMRETLMQLLLILEVMLLNRAISRKPELAPLADNAEAVNSNQDDTAGSVANTHPQKKEKKRDLSRELDTIVDRLCIWHSVDLHLPDAAGKPQGDEGTAKPNESLRDFCKDVLLPFYSAKLPDQVRSLSRKLGGPEISPTRPKSKSRATQPATGLRATKPSTARTAGPRGNAKQTLERVLSEDNIRRHASPPLAVSRQNSVPVNNALPTLKREPLERPVSRGGMLSKSLSFSNREIDLVADSKAHQVKRRKLEAMARQKSDLQAAIETLKKPSRSRVAAAFMDDMERRQQTLQISATPKARRVKDESRHLDPESLPSPRRTREVTVIPSSTMKPRVPRGAAAVGSTQSFHATERGHSTASCESPSRRVQGGVSCRPPTLQPDTEDDIMNNVAATPLPKAQQVSAQSNSLSSPSLAVMESPLKLRMSRSSRPVLFTPIRRSEVKIEEVFRDAPEIPASAGRTMDRAMGGKGRALEHEFLFGSMVTSHENDVWRRDEAELNDDDLYERLGWHDDDLDL